MTQESPLKHIQPWQIFEFSEYRPDSEKVNKRLCVALPDWSKTRDRFSLEYLELRGDGTGLDDQLTRYFVNYSHREDEVFNLIIRSDLRLKIIIDGGQPRFKVERITTAHETPVPEIKIGIGDRVKYKYILNGKMGYTGTVSDVDSGRTGRTILVVDGENNKDFSNWPIKIAPLEDWEKIPQQD